jgi:hypothetical protein
MERIRGLGEGHMGSHDKQAGGHCKRFSAHDRADGAGIGALLGKAGFFCQSIGAGVPILRGFLALRPAGRQRQLVN